MSGLTNGQREFLLGYDDNHKSTEESRALHWVLFNSANYRPDMIIAVVGNRVFMRAPKSELEYRLAKQVESVFKRIMRVN